MNRFNNGKIYAIRSHQTEEIYIGSTTQALYKRLYEHRAVYKNYKIGDANISSFQILKYSDHYIELLELCSCGSKAELCKREGELIRDNNSVNKVIPGRTPYEYYIDNIEKIKEYLHVNKNEITEKAKKYRVDNKFELNEKCRKWRDDNKNEVSGYNKKYNLDNKIKNIEKRKQKYNDSKNVIIFCECGKNLTKPAYYKHLKTKSHLFYLSTLNFIFS
jgi:hypothetical protein